MDPLYGFPTEKLMKQHTQKYCRPSCRVWILKHRIKLTQLNQTVLRTVWDSGRWKGIPLHRTFPQQQSALFSIVSPGTIPHMWRALKADLMRQNCCAPPTPFSFGFPLSHPLSLLFLTSHLSPLGSCCKWCSLSLSFSPPLTHTRTTTHR